MSENAKHCLQGLTVHSVTHQIANHANSMVFDIEHKIILVRKALLEDDVPHCMLHFCECFLPDVAAIQNSGGWQSKHVVGIR
jgi:hypothetical protein